MKAKVIETGEIVNVVPNPTWYKEAGQGPDRREWDEDELDFNFECDTVQELVGKFKAHNKLKFELWELCNLYAQGLERVKKNGEEFTDFGLVDGKVTLFFIDAETMEPCMTYTTVEIKDLLPSQKGE